MTESDIELLKLAAKAAGYEVEFGQGMAFNHEGTGPQSWADWNPLEDDGDALRLAVGLGLDIDRTAKEWVTVRIPGGGFTGSTKLDDHPHRATRHAITRAAAEIGRNMKEN